MNDEKKISVVKSIVNIILMLIICIVSGCLDFLKWEFHIERIYEITFWLQTGMKFTYLICAKMIGMNLFEDAKRRTNEVLQYNKTKYEELNNLRGADFPVWVETKLNPRIKKEKYIKKMQRKVAQLEKRTNNRYRLLYVLGEEEKNNIINCYKKKSWKKKANKYLIKRKRLEDLMADDFVDKNINFLNIKFCRNVNPSVFDLTINAKQKYNSYRVTSHMATAKFSGLIISSVLMVVMNMVFTIIGMTPDGEEALSQAERFWNAFIKMMVDFAFMAWQFFAGTREIGYIINFEETTAYANRNRILKSYLIETGKIQDINEVENLKTDFQKKIDTILSKFKV